MKAGENMSDEKKIEAFSYDVTVENFEHVNRPKAAAILNAHRRRDLVPREEISALKSAVETMTNERDAYKLRGDGHRDTLRSIREFARKAPVDIERIILWCSDALSGYTEPVEVTVGAATDRALAAESALAAMKAQRDGLALHVAHFRLYGGMVEADADKALTACNLRITPTGEVEEIR